ncbi:unnamed protein product [Euphydryas editha]|uniref:Uncharacterized protein n=1 Tax=Euphydryas editha TaxID=104508 RepID=A0AAU9V983_EUPED|nr:unnamed protein product [Euphydryas editha]
MRVRARRQHGADWARGGGGAPRAGAGEGRPRPAPPANDAVIARRPAPSAARPALARPARRSASLRRYIAPRFGRGSLGALYHSHLVIYKHNRYNFWVLR